MTLLSLLFCLGAAALIYAAAPHCPLPPVASRIVLRRAGGLLLLVGLWSWSQLLHPAAAIFVTLSLAMLAFGLLPWLALPWLALPWRRTPGGRR
ncbi:hypothetical protein [Azonexus sp.]|uniref:hypothetical protein n=1 Tax=Azonexus sp. TaxID=1872668 RepID=UPI0027B9EDC6|nr:hypothetical protein [Azonexus sp.]